ncbi:hypothetical protein QEH40_gp08 [Microbacterium phage OscarSo]|uniref:Uncharacterized protein n=1 Tax=Microbacterium phage OscarSo TaxID=2985324 RepID=A0A9X9P6B8_9CAUD|nr:hypothetical protein QEH40_gp08 [Microbacterium phage OscarSo]UYL87129.1 hypothetical protein SEA_OSCARSO_8 [Microbacterium phage OscarSo]
MPAIRTTLEPSKVIDVSDAEYAFLARMGLIYTGTEPPLAPPSFSPEQYAEISRPDGPLVTLLVSGIGERIVAAGDVPPVNAQLWIKTSVGGDPDAIELYFEDGTP